MNPADELWHWAGATYRRDAVKTACLALQDAHGVDVDVVLWICWLSARGLRPTEPALVDAAALSRALENTVMQPLRAARRAMAQAPPELSAADVSQFRARALELELDIERAEMTALTRLPVAKVPGAAAEDLALVGLRLYAREADLDPLTDFAPLARAVFP